jgi:hypothetical protein
MKAFVSVDMDHEEAAWKNGACLEDLFE